MDQDPALLRRFREGDRLAMAAFYERYVSAVVRMLRAAAFRHAGCEALRSGMELENAICEVFARAFETRARLAYDGIRPYEGFLAGIVRNLVLEESRSRLHAVQQVPMDDETAQSVPLPESAETQLEDRELQGLLSGFQAQLSPEEAQLFELRFEVGLPQEEAAQKLNVTRIQLRRRELALRKELLGHLKKRGYLRDWVSSGWSFFKRRAGT